MRRGLLGMMLLVGAVGCSANGGRINLLRSNGPAQPAVATEVPAKEDLVAYLNNISRANPGIQSNDIGLTCYAGGPIGIPVSGKIRAQGPRNFRMTADALGAQEVDLGSNSQEFWYWIKRAEPNAQVFCSYQAIEEGRVKQMPFPFQPDWVLEAMGMGNYGPPEKYELAVEATQLKLIEKTRSPQGVPVKKIIVFNRSRVPVPQPQVTDFLCVEEATGKMLCSAHIARRQIVAKTVELPQELELRWPEQKLKLVLHLNGIQLNNQFPPQVFARTQLKNIPTFDLATGRMEGMQQAGGIKGPRD